MVPEHVVAFIRSCIKSVWALDVLLLLRSEPRAWSSLEISSRLRAVPPLVAKVLDEFRRSALVVEEPPGQFRYAPANEADGLVSELAKIYAERPMTIIKEILSAPNETIQSFVDAFRLKKE